MSRRSRPGCATACSRPGCSRRRRRTDGGAGRCRASAPRSGAETVEVGTERGGTGAGPAARSTAVRRRPRARWRSISKGNAAGRTRSRPGGPARAAGAAASAAPLVRALVLRVAGDLVDGFAARRRLEDGPASAVHAALVGDRRRAARGGDPGRRRAPAARRGARRCSRCSPTPTRPTRDAALGRAHRARRSPRRDRADAHPIAARSARDAQDHRGHLHPRRPGGGRLPQLRRGDARRRRDPRRGGRRPGAGSPGGRRRQAAVADGGAGAGCQLRWLAFIFSCYCSNIEHVAAANIVDAVEVGSGRAAALPAALPGRGAAGAAAHRARPSPRVDARTGTPCVVKVFAAGAAARGAALAEFRGLETLAHPSIVRVRDVGPPRRWTAVPGHRPNRRTRAWTASPPSPTTRAGAGALERAARELADALAHLHGRGLVHGDICPANVRLARSDGRAPCSSTSAWPARRSPATGPRAGRSATRRPRR